MNYPFGNMTRWNSLTDEYLLFFAEKSKTIQFLKDQHKRLSLLHNLNQAAIQTRTHKHIHCRLIPRFIKS